MYKFGKAKALWGMVLCHCHLVAFVGMLKGALEALTYDIDYWRSLARNDVEAMVMHLLF